MVKAKATLLALGLGAALILGGCSNAKDAAQNAADKGSEMTQQAKEKAGEAADKAKEKAGEMADEAKEKAGEAMEVASTTFNDATEVTEETADSFKEKAMSAYVAMEEQFNKAKENLDEDVVKEMQPKFASLKEKLDGLKDKTGMELVKALNEIKTEGAELAAELKSMTGGDSGATPAPTATPSP